MNKDIKIILTDLDQTFLRTNRTISRHSIDIVNRCKKQGILFGAATARSESAAASYLKIINPDIVISSAGAMTRYKGEVISRQMIGKDTTNDVLADFLNNEFISEIMLETKDNYYWNYTDILYVPTDYQHVIYNDYKTPLNQPVYKLTVKTSDKISVKNIIDKYEDLEMILFRDEPWVKIAHKKATKENACKCLSAYFGLNNKNMMAFGDDYSDIKMLKFCGIGVAVDNAIDEVKQAADYVCKSNDEDGVAAFIEEHILNNY